MFIFKIGLFSLILGFIICTSFAIQETTQETEKWKINYDFMSDEICKMKANKLTGSNEINLQEVRNIIERIMSVVEDNSKKLEDISKKTEANFIKIENQFDKDFQDLIETINEKNNNTKDDAFSETRSKCTSMCEVKVRNLATEVGTEFKWRLEEADSCVTKALNVCEPNPCNGGLCEVNAQGRGYNCTRCPNSTYGRRCENVRCDEANKCFQHQNTAYFAFEVKLIWEEAKRKCEDEGMTLAMPKDRESSEFLMSQLAPIYRWDASHVHVKFWIGLKQFQNPKQWRWVDGSPLGDYTGGFDDFKDFTSKLCGVLDVASGSRTKIWEHSYFTNEWYPLCEKRLSPR